MLGPSFQVLNTPFQKEKEAVCSECFYNIQHVPFSFVLGANINSRCQLYTYEMNSVYDRRKRYAMTFCTV